MDNDLLDDELARRKEVLNRLLPYACEPGVGEIMLLFLELIHDVDALKRARWASEKRKRWASDPYDRPDAIVDNGRPVDA